MKKLTTIILMILCVATLFAQAPEKFTYQAVVRNAGNSLVANAQVGVRVSILQGSASGSAVYVETHIATTNANGLLTLEIGGGSVQQGTFSSIDWANGPFFLQTETDPNGGSNYTISSTQQLLSVPYALYAKKAENGFSGDYNDLTNKPQNVSAFTNDAGYINAAQVPAQVNADWNATTGPAEILNKPAIPTVPTNVSAFTNDAEYITNAQLTALLFALNNRIDSLQTLLNMIAPNSIDFMSCPEIPTVTDIDGNVYSTVQIGNQCWMRQNLRTTHYSDSTEIPLGTTDSYTVPYRYAPNNDEANVAIYGYLYNWPAMMHGANHSESNPSGVQGICPTGWHAPSAGEWEQLQVYVSNQSEFVCGGGYNIGKALAAATGWDESSSNCSVGNEQSTNNATGFSAFPAGCYGYPSYVFGGTAGFWTTSSYNGDYDADHRDLQSYGAGIFGGSEDRNIGFSVRCVRD